MPFQVRPAPAVVAAMGVCLGLMTASPRAARAAPDLVALLEAELAPHFRAGQPGAAVLVRKGDTILLRKGYGLADLEKRRPIRPELVFRLGSITKQFTAAAIMILVDEGKLAVGDDIRKHLPTYPAQGAIITVEHLLTHTSGIPDYTNQPSFPKRIGEDIEPTALVDLWKDLPLEFPPGTRRKYSNSGYHLLGLIIEKVSGKKYAQFIAERIFSPLGMTHSACGDDPKLDRAAGHDAGPDGPVRPAAYINMKIPYAAGALVSSVDDLARWDSAIAAGKLLKKESWQQVFTRARLKDGSRSDYGYGWTLGALDGQPAQRHGGGIPGFSTHILRMPEQHLLVAVLMNSIPGPVDPGLLAHRLALAALGKPLVDPKTRVVAAAVLDRYVGVYRMADGRSFLVRREGDHLSVQPPRGPRQDAWPESDRRFFVKGHPLRYGFTPGATGNVVELAITRPNGDVDRLTRTSEKLPAERVSILLAPELLERYVGEYRLSRDFAITITRSGRQLFAQATNQPRLELFASAPGEFFARAVDAQLSFRGNAGAPAQELVLHQNGRQQPGKRIH